MIGDTSREKIARARQVHSSGQAGESEQLFDLGSQRYACVVGDEIERLDAEAVARGEQALLHIVPDDEGEHPAETRERLLPPDLVSPQEDFTVRLGAEYFAALRQLLAEFQVVVQFAVENEMKSAR